jgi:hypothetical protein
MLAYFLPLLLGVAAFSPRRGRWLLPIAVLLAAACFLLVRPFNFYGGGGAIANRYFLPLYPALWFLAVRPPAGPAATGRRWRRSRWRRWRRRSCCRLWSAPRAFPSATTGATGTSAIAARRLLPYETTQSHLPGGRDVSMGGVWVKVLAGPVERVGESGLEVYRWRSHHPARRLAAPARRPAPRLRATADRVGSSSPARRLAGTLLAGDGAWPSSSTSATRARSIRCGGARSPGTLYQITFTPSVRRCPPKRAGAHHEPFEPASGGSIEELLR